VGAVSVDDKVPFLVIRTLEAPVPHRTPIFVRAQTIQEAYTAAINHDPVVHPKVSFEIFVVSAGEMANALLLKELAAFYWDLGRQAEANPNHEPTFEDAWDEHGADPSHDT
jgi:hypothetical protein